VRLDRRRQLLVGQILNPEIERQGQVAAHLRSLDRSQITNGIAMAITQDLPLARPTGQPVLISALNAFLALVVHVGETHHLRGDRARRIVAAIFALQRQPRQPHGGNPDGLLWRDRAPHAEFATGFTRQDSCQLGRRDVEHPGQMRELVSRQVEFG
jgi:hypothetical protein